MMGFGFIGFEPRRIRELARTDAVLGISPEALQFLTKGVDIIKHCFVFDSDTLENIS
jgi:hypothetical protein